MLVHSMSVEISNNSVVSTTSYTNMHINYKLLTTMSVDDEQFVFKFNTIFKYIPFTNGSFAKRSERMFNGKVAVI